MIRSVGLLNWKNEPYWDIAVKAFLHAGIAGARIAPRSWRGGAGRSADSRPRTRRSPRAGARGGGEFSRPFDDVGQLSVETRTPLRVGAGVRRRGRCGGQGGGRRSEEHTSELQ